MLLPTRRIYLNAFKCIMYFVCYVMHDKKIVKQDWIYPIPSQNNIGPLNRFELTFCVLHFKYETNTFILNKLTPISVPKIKYNLYNSDSFMNS